MPGEPKDNKYAYQIEYEKEGEKYPQIASLEITNISDSKEGIDVKFKPFRKKRIDEELEQNTKDLKEIEEKFKVGEGIKQALIDDKTKLEKQKAEAKKE